MPRPPHPSDSCSLRESNNSAQDCHRLQKRSASHQPSRQRPSLESNSHCSSRMMKNAISAVRHPTMVTVIQSMLRSRADSTLPLNDFRDRSRQRREDSLIASCIQSTEVKDEYHTRTPFSLISGTSSRASWIASFPLNRLGVGSYVEIVFVLFKRKPEVGVGEVMAEANPV